MNQKNLDYLKENLKYLGFGDKLLPELEKNIQQGFPEFKLSLQNEYGKDKLNAELFFRKSDQSDMYFFNRYDAKLTNEVGSQSQSFHLNKGNGITLKEAYNLLDGRAVHKELTNNEGQKYNAWVQLDFKNKDENGNYKMKQFHQNYGYDLEKALSSLPLKELNNEQSKEMLMRSLQRGNIQSVTFEKEGKEEKMFIEANPQFKTVKLYDKGMQRVQLQSIQQTKTEDRSIKQAVKKEDQKQSLKQPGNSVKPGIEKSRRKGQSIS